jgi:hypothetical protein
METDSISTLRALSVSSMPNNSIIFVKGYFNPGDGGGGQFIYLSSSAATDDTGVYIKPSVGSGVWKRMFDGGVNVKWFGALGDGNPGVNEGINIQAAIDYVHYVPGYGEVIFPPAWYKIDTDLNTYSNITLKGIGNPYIFRRGTCGGGLTGTIASTTSAYTGMIAGTYNNVPASSGGSGTWARFQVVVTNATTIGSVTVTTPGNGYVSGDVLTFNGSLFGGTGTGTRTIAVANIVADNYFITINDGANPSNWVHSKVAIDGIMFAGDESYHGATDLNYKAHLIALRIMTNSFHINNCGLFGFEKTTKFESHSYLVSFNSCSFRQNYYGFHYDFTGLSDSWENIKILDSVIAGNHYGIYNKLGEIYLNNCSIDYNTVHIQDNFTKNSGYLSAPMTIDNCHFETNDATSFFNVRITNSGVLVVNNCTFVDSAGPIFYNSDQLILTNNSFVLAEGKYLVSGSGLTSESNSTAITDFSIARINKQNSGIRNGSFDHGLEGWTVTAGSSSQATTTDIEQYDSLYSLQIRPTDLNTGTYLTSDFIPVPVNRLGYMISCFVTYATRTGAIVVSSFDKNKTYLGHALTVNTASTTTPAKIDFRENFYTGTAFLQIEIRCFNGVTTQSIYIDDFYISFQDFV